MRTTLLKLIGIFLFVIILLKIDLGELLALLTGLNLLYLTLILLFTVPLVMMKALRWQMILRNHGIDYGYKDCFLAYLATTYLGNLTPGRLGEVAKVFYLKQDKKVGIGAGATSVVLDRLYDIAVLLVAGMAGMMIYWPGSIAIQAVAVIFVVVITVLAITNRRMVKHLSQKLFLRFLPEGHRARVESHFDDFYTNLKKTTPKEVCLNLLLTLVIYGVLFFQSVLFARALGLNLSYLFVMTNIALANIVNLLPVSIFAGIGTRDFVMIFLFRSQGLGESQAVAFATLILSSVLFASLLGLACWAIKPIKKGK